MRIKRIITFVMIALLFVIVPQKASAEEEKTLQDEIIYRVLVDRLNNGNPALNENIDIDDLFAYNGGDIQGITLKLDAIKDSGFTAIAISPIMQNAPDGYHGNWIEDFYEIEEQFGSFAEFNTLVKQAHNQQIKVILDLPLNYIAKSSPLVEEADKQTWFKENETEPIGATEWLDNVYVFDQENEDVQQYLIDVALFWMNETDIDGINLRAIDQMSPSFVETLTDEIKAENPDFYILGSTLQGEEDVTYLHEYNIDAIENWKMFQAMNDTFSQIDEPVSSLQETWTEVGSEKDLLFVDNEITARFSNNTADHGRNALTTWKLALAYMYFTPGVPIVYQGSEVPMYGPGYPESQMLVDFISADPDLEQAFNQIAAVRKNFPSLVHGDYELVESSEGLTLFKRTLDDETVYVAINNGSESQTITLTDIDSDLQLRGLLYDDTIRENKNGEFIVGVSREAAEVFVVQPKTGLNWSLILFPAGIFIIFVIAVIVLARKQKQREAANEA